MCPPLSGVRVDEGTGLKIITRLSAHILGYLNKLLKIFISKAIVLFKKILRFEKKKGRGALAALSKKFFPK